MNQPYGYLVAAGIVAWHTLHALAPLRRPPLLGRISFLSGVAINELPLLAACWLAAVTVWTGAEGDLTTAVGGATLALTAVTCAGLAVIARRGLGTQRAVDAAMTETFGPRWRTSGRTRPPRGLVWALRVRRRGVVRLAGLRYGPHARHLVDVLRHRSRPAGGPLLVFFHGGGYHGGRRNREARALLYRLAEAGWVCVTADYRLRPDAGFDEHLADARAAVGWARDHAPGHEAVFVAGSSAGAHLSAHLALTDPSISGAICLSGYYGRYYGHADAGSSPMDRIGGQAPAFFVAHGERDSMVPAGAAREFAGWLRENSARPVVHAELPGGQHSFDLFASPRFTAVADAVEAFTVLVRRSGRGAGTRRALPR